jgi:hypothetical protein
MPFSYYLNSQKMKFSPFRDQKLSSILKEDLEIDADEILMQKIKLEIGLNTATRILKELRQ